MAVKIEPALGAPRGPVSRLEVAFDEVHVVQAERVAGPQDGRHVVPVVDRFDRAANSPEAARQRH